MTEIDTENCRAAGQMVLASRGRAFEALRLVARQPFDGRPA